jgi:RNA polymerase sigma-70 factor, ECF subfamily
MAARPRRSRRPEPPVASSDANFPVAPVVYLNQQSGGPGAGVSPGGGNAVERKPTAPRLDEDQLAPLVERARLGETAAFEEIVRVMQGPVRAFARRMMRDAHLGDDAAQEIFLRMWKGIRRHEPRGRFVAWTFTVARNTCIELLRREKRTPMPVESDEETAGGDEAEAHALKRVVDDALAALDEPYRSTFLLRETGLAYEELAQTLHCPVGTVRSRLHEARRRLALTLAPVIGGEA